MALLTMALAEPTGVGADIDALHQPAPVFLWCRTRSM